MPLVVALHILGVALGLGTAMVSDFLFHQALRESGYGPAYTRLAPLLSGIIWFGLFILIISGVMLFLEDPTAYLASSKFVAKMGVVGVLIINGLLLHFRLLPEVKKLTLNDWSKHTKQLDTVIRRGLLLGIVSSVSWFTALILGAYHSLPYTTPAILFTYILAIAFAYIGSLLYFTWALNTRVYRR